MSYTHHFVCWSTCIERAGIHNVARCIRWWGEVLSIFFSTSVTRFNRNPHVFQSRYPMPRSGRRCFYLKIAAVAAFGFFGALLRFFITENLGTMHGFPTATLFINLTGAFILGWFYTITIQRMYVHPLFRLGLGTGFLGAFTTFSTFAVEMWKLMNAGMDSTAALYVTFTVIGGLLACWIGILAGSWQAYSRRPLQRRSR